MATLPLPEPEPTGPPLFTPWHDVQPALNHLPLAFCTAWVDDGQVHVLTVAGDPGVEGRWCIVGVLVH